MTEILLKMPFAERLDFGALDQGDVRIAYRATDTIWRDVAGDGGCIGLRDHVQHLCLAALELNEHPVPGAWDGVAYNLQLAYALTDLIADTDVDGASGRCSPVANFEAVNSERAAKYLAAATVFTFVWTAYECAVGSLTAGNGGKGARGRDLIATLNLGEPPLLRPILFRALALSHGFTDFAQRDMCRAVRTAMLSPIAAEHLRQFRNHLIHGDIALPLPEDWGSGSSYVIDEDRYLRQFHANTRLALLMLQLLSAHDAGEDRELGAWLDEPGDARAELLRLHLAPGECSPDMLDLAFGDEEPTYRTSIAYANLFGS